MASSQRPQEQEEKPVVARPSRFVALCPRFPELSLTVWQLRKIMEDEGFKDPAPVLHFHGGVYDSLRDELPDAAVPIAYKAIMECDEYKNNLIAVQEYFS